ANGSGAGGGAGGGASLPRGGAVGSREGPRARGRNGVRSASAAGTVFSLQRRRYCIGAQFTSAMTIQLSSASGRLAASAAQGAQRPNRTITAKLDLIVTSSSRSHRRGRRVAASEEGDSLPSWS